MSKQNLVNISDVTPGKAQRRMRYLKRMEHMRRDKAARFA